MSWRQILGHDAIVASFASAWKRGRLGQAYLFVGFVGLGKHTFARQLAKTILCEARGDTFDSCDVCTACKLVEAGTHPDLFMVCRPEDKLEFPIDVIKKELLPSLALKPSHGSRKVAILDDADDLNEESANAFLKSLEEPPPGSLLLLVGGPNAERQLPTILSRCQLIRFSPLASPLVTRILAERGIADPIRQNRLLQLAGGCPGQALALDDDEIWTFRQELIVALAQPRFDPVTVSRHWMEFIDGAGKEASAHRKRATLVIRMLVALLETALKLSLGAAISGIDPAEEQALRKCAERLGEDRLLAWINRALEADQHIDRRVQLVLAIEALLEAISRDATI